METKDAVLAKIAIIRNCLTTIRRVCGTDASALDDPIKQDVFVLNLERAAQAAIDMANLVIAEKGFMMPSSYKQAFLILAKNNVIQSETASNMGKMAGFRNIAVHDYQQLDPVILKAILTTRLPDLEGFCSEIYSYNIEQD